MRKVVLFVLLVLLVGVPVFAQDEELPTLAELVASREDLSSFAAAAEVVGLTSFLENDTTYNTLFIPNNDAFAAVLESGGYADLNAVVEALTPEGTAIVLASHVAPGYLTSAAVLALDEANEEAYWLATLTPGFYLSVQDAVINESVNLVETDLLASNGVIHIIDTVMLPTGEQTTAAVELLAGEDAQALTAARAEAGTIPEVATAAGSFSTLVAAADAAGLVELLSNGEYTVFAPTDEAFAAAFETLGVTAEDVLADTETLTGILAYHVVPGAFPASVVAGMNGVYVGTLLQDAVLQITVEDGTVAVNGATVSAVDVAASNGIIHVIDGVLLPPAAEAEE